MAMFPGEDLLQEGIAAFQAGDRARAHDLLSEVVKIDPENEQAWYYLAASESNPTLRKQYLQQVLEINPENTKAREVLDRIVSRETESPADDTPAPRASSSGSRSTIHALDPAMEAAPGEADDQAGSFRIPVKIPGAPERTTWEHLARDGAALLVVSLNVALRKPDVYEDEVARATWWRFWLIAGAAAVGGGILSIFNALFLQIRFSDSLFNIIAVLLTPFFFVAVALLSLFAGAYVSHRWAMMQGGIGALVKHAYTIALVWAPLLLLNGVISLVGNLLGFNGFLTTLVLIVYGVIVIADGFEHLHAFANPRQKWFTSGVMVAVIAVITLVLGVLLGGLIVSGALPFV